MNLFLSEFISYKNIEDLRHNSKYAPAFSIIHRSPKGSDVTWLFVQHFSARDTSAYLLFQRTFYIGSIVKMEDNIVNNVIDLYKVKKWREIVDKFHDHPNRNKLLWVFPSEENFRFLGECLKQLECDKVLSVGCGSGLLEWMITEATGYPVTGVEVDGAWWHCKYAPPTFIPLLLTTTELDRDAINALENASTALLFCYFNNRPAFEQYLKHYQGNVLIIIGPDGNGVHTDPKPFNNVSSDWTLVKWQEVRNSRDFIAVYCKNKC